MKLEDLGWNDYFKTQFENQKASDELKPARISQEHKGIYNIINENGEYLAEISGKMRYTAVDSDDFPVVGDWVVARIYPDEGKAIIHSILNRKNCFSRKEVSGRKSDSKGKIREQVLAANIDTVFLINGLDNDFSLRRMERYMTVVYDSIMNPVIILNKIDLVIDPDDYIGQAKSIAFGAPVIPVCGLNSTGFDELKRYILPGNTIVFLGSSGVGKSTIINRLFGTDRQRVNAVRENDHKGRHTTTSRELMVLPDGGILIDTPGMKEFQPFKGEEDTERAFEDIHKIALKCRFRDCKHESEPGCAVHEAIKNGELDHGRYKNYTRMKREARYLENRMNGSAQLAEKRRWKAISKIQKQYKENT